METKVLVCSCNGTVELGGAFDASEAAASGLAVSPVTALCRREMGRFLEAVAGTDDVLVTCTQESALFREVAAARRSVAPIRFVNIREQAGWGRDGASAAPKIAALVAMAATTADEAIPTVQYRSGGRLLIVGDAGAAFEWAEQLHGTLSVSVLVTGRAWQQLPAQRRFPIMSGDAVEIRGWLGAFRVGWQQRNPIDLDACVRCGACVEACPEGAIGPSLQVDAERCRGHRACVEACGGIGAIDFARSDTARDAEYDLVLDLRRTPAFDFDDPPQGYFHCGPDPAEQLQAVLKLSTMIGEFEKPKYFDYDARICAHGRNGKTGCTACIDVCSTRAISSLGDRIQVEPHLCMGCGGCTSVCPSGAIRYAYPSAPVLGARLRAGLAAFRKRGGEHPSLLFHDGEAGTALVESLARGSAAQGSTTQKLIGRGPADRRPSAPGLPARLIPVAVHHPASVGLDLALAAIAWGAASVTVLFTPDTSEHYAEALTRQFETGRRLLSAVGLDGDRLRVLRTGDRLELTEALHGHARIALSSVGRAATFALPGEKRRAIDFALAHLSEQAEAAGRELPTEVALAAGAPFGSLRIRQDACTLCLACVGACPESALLDGSERPQLRFIERNCVQCGLCETTCPEDAITLQPRYLFDQQARSPRVLNEAEPFHCVCCGKAFGTRQMIDSMTARLATHSMFGGKAMRRLQMCADCRVVDLVSATDEATIHDYTGREA
ncbi:MAG TPA: 4Fe-4S binding protein [Burkholderiaceae bacterium]|nr:4Fe-4S binding protein [Burkholderiaceae bacterium]